MINFCTLFDSNYLSRGLALHRSLSAVCSSFHLYVIAFNDSCYEYLSKADIPNLTPISLKEFEDEQLLAIKPTRSAAEYCWTCTPSIILYCIRQFGLPSCTYVDADMMFYHDPHVLLEEMGGNSVLISEHNYTREYKKTGITNGIYCVQFMFFKNDERGMIALQWWRDRCLEWCYDRLEDGKFGDQKYLDDWPQRFAGVHVMQHPGGGVAPWNLQQFVFHKKDNKLFITARSNEKTYPLIFFHFHGLKFYTDDAASCCSWLYDLRQDVKKLVYMPYIKDLVQTDDRLKEQLPHINSNGARSAAPGSREVFFGFLIELAAGVRRGSASPFRLKNYNFVRHYHLYKLDNFH